MKYRPVASQEEFQEVRGVLHDQPPQLTDANGTFSSVSGLPGTLCHVVDDAWWPCRLKTRSRKGGDPSEWPEDLRVREFPRAEA